MERINYRTEAYFEGVRDAQRKINDKLDCLYKWYIETVTICQTAHINAEMHKEEWEAQIEYEYFRGMLVTVSTCYHDGISKAYSLRNHI